MLSLGPEPSYLWDIYLKLKIVMQPPVPPPPAPSGCAALGLRSMSCAAFSLIILYIVLLPLLLLFVRVRTLHARGERLDFRSLLGAHCRRIDRIFSRDDLAEETCM